MLINAILAAALCAGPVPEKTSKAPEMLMTAPEGPSAEEPGKPDSTLFSNGEGDATGPGFRSAPRPVSKDAAYKPKVSLGGEQPTAEEIRKEVDRMLSGGG